MIRDNPAWPSRILPVRPESLKNCVDSCNHILDEGQRIKNWETKTSRMIKALKSPFALVLTGTPLENRLDDLYSVVEFIDDRRLGPAFRFFNRYRVTDERGRVLGYKNLDELREKLSPVLLRRTRKMVLDELPPRMTEILRIPPTGEQIELHNGHQKIIQTIIGKKYLTEMDMLSSGIEELNRRMEILLGNKPDAPPDESVKAQVEREAQIFGNRDRMASAGGQLFSAAFAFIGEMFSGKPDSEETQRLAGLFKEKLAEGTEKGADGQLRMTISFPDENALNGLAKTLARMAG